MPSSPIVDTKAMGLGKIALMNSSCIFFFDKWDGVIFIERHLSI
jgi:hypothetical protein